MYSHWEPNFMSITGRIAPDPTRSGGRNHVRVSRLQVMSKFCDIYRTHWNIACLTQWHLHTAITHGWTAIPSYDFLWWSSHFLPCTRHFIYCLRLFFLVKFFNFWNKFLSFQQEVDDICCPHTYLALKWKFSKRFWQVKVHHNLLLVFCWTLAVITTTIERRILYFACNSRAATTIRSLNAPPLQSFSWL